MEENPAPDKHEALRAAISRLVTTAFWAGFGYGLLAGTGIGILGAAATAALLRRKA